MNKQLFAKLALIAFGAGAGAGAAHAGLATSTFQVQMTITASCAVTTAPTNINLGSVAAQTTAVTQTGSNTFKVNCSKSTPFYIGLAPSNANTAGAGVMSGTGSNGDKVPYTLYQDAGFGTVWGNTATSLAVGNGKSGTGAGMASGNAVSFTAYAKATSADFTPDTYTDTVTVNVNY
ncbi:spore coat U domain-containing protein [Rhodoferax sediminis]|uniref:SCPU domain-containing protein n=1 Tax=Rhodoferax sediminis TaxID=2509614 RepID=A0A515D6G0_9BURK|nr:spore coat protein U domain-containing protein [Rhodoferax sediminis]QDL35984.1 SCPU domain-containing protein [Rhodoferax sediminis]